MLGLTDYITTASWDDIAVVAYFHVDNAHKTLVARYGPRRSRGPEPEVSDSEVITCTLLCELLFQGDEERFCHYLAQHMRHLFPRQLDRSQFNRRRRALIGEIELIRRMWREALIPAEENVRLIDSAPVPVCTYARSNRCQTVQGAEYCGQILSKKAKFFGFRFHATVTPDQLVDEWLLAPASYHDSRPAPELLYDDCNVTVIGDNAYTSAPLEEQLWEDAMVVLMPIRRPNEHRQWPYDIHRLLIGVRMRVETAFSQLTTVLGFGLTGARSLLGVVNRVASKVLAHTFCYLWHRASPSP